ncbi:DUF559 domain-containing protein [Ornithinimicrobium tianjinense]|uniref:DUF559 domain-containing protein n=1 Tax=Ornithinimicrobium tianjinense TaxID=1195761 RepID=A0A917EZG8_9MICO|nr:DUF559 domain-containing protein [Ornithinimicrobium tianjinense]GGF36898.1 hypothetical protein GCM10011366_00650 [Ornithinimicrobium tianjinense]
MPQTPPPALAPGLLTLVRSGLDAHAGTLTAADLSAFGAGGGPTRQLLAGKVLLRVGRAAFVDLDRYQAADAAGRHVLAATAIARTWPPRVLVSHTTAALMHGLPLTLEPDRVHGCRLGAGQHRKRTGYTIHTGYVDADPTVLNGVQVVEPRLAVMGVAELHGRDEAVVVGDAALHQQLVTVDDLRRTADTHRHHPVHATFARAVELMDARSESAAETRSRLLLQALGFDPVPQVVIRDDAGEFLGRVDFLLRGTRVIVEIDGMVKYTDREALLLEKRREMGLQRAGYTVVRLVWADLSSPAKVRAMLEAALAADTSRA